MSENQKVNSYSSAALSFEYNHFFVTRMMIGEYKKYAKKKLGLKIAKFADGEVYHVYPISKCVLGTQ